MPPKSEPIRDLIDLNDADGVGIENVNEFEDTLMSAALAPDDPLADTDSSGLSAGPKSKSGGRSRSSSNKRQKAAKIKLSPEMQRLEAKWSGKLLGKFKLKRMLGHGVMGIVFQAKDIHLERTVALKVLRRRINGTDKADRVELFLREARAAASIDHPNIVQIHEISQVQGWWYIAMEYLEGGSVQQLLKSHGTLDTLKACQITIDAARGLEEAHEAGIIHRDIKPANLMLARKGRCKVADFGLVRFQDNNDPFRMNDAMVGTPVFIAPEIVRKQSASAASDIYALGTSLYYMLSGHVPFKGNTPQEVYRLQVEGQIPDIRTLVPDVSENLANIIKTTLAKNPKDRPTANVLALQLQNEMLTISPNGTFNSWGSAMMGAVNPVSSTGGMASMSAIQTFATAGVSSLALPEAQGKSLAARRYELRVVAGAAVLGAVAGGAMVGLIGMFSHAEPTRRIPVAAPDAIVAPLPSRPDPVSAEMATAIEEKAKAYAYWGQIKDVKGDDALNQKVLDAEIAKNTGDSYFQAQQWESAGQAYQTVGNLSKLVLILDPNKGRHPVAAAAPPTTSAGTTATSSPAAPPTVAQASEAPTPASAPPPKPAPTAPTVPIWGKN